MKNIWIVWVGPKARAPWLDLCLETVRRRAGVPVTLVTDANLGQFVRTPLHKDFRKLSYVHQSDYLRCYLLHYYGGMYLDVDSVCLRDLGACWDILQNPHIWGGGYDGRPWGDVIGVGAIGPMRPRTPLTNAWYDALQGKMNAASFARGDPFCWSEILRETVLPITRQYAAHLRTPLRIENPSDDVLLDPESQYQPQAGTHMLVLNNSLWGHKVASQTRAEMLSAPCPLARLLLTYATTPAPADGTQ